MEPLLDAAALARQLGVSTRWVYAQVEEHSLPHYRFGRALAFEATAVRSWLYRHRAGEWPQDCDAVSSADFISGNMTKRADG